MCKKDGCTKVAFYGIFGKKVRYCASHKKTTSVDIRDYIKELPHDIRQYICHICQQVDNTEDVSQWPVLSRNLDYPINIIMECAICKCYGVWNVVNRPPMYDVNNIEPC
jgi:hypothetical protein